MRPDDPTHCDGRALRPPDPRAAAETWRRTTSTGGRATSSTSTVPSAPATWSSSRWRTIPARQIAGLAADGPGRRARRCSASRRPPVRRRPAHHVAAGRADRDRHAVGGGALLADPTRCGHRARPHLPRPHPALRPAPRHDARRPTTSSGTSATSCSPGIYTGTYTATATTYDVDGWIGPARPLVGHPRPRSLPAVDVVPDPARRRLPRRLALGARQRRARLHRRLLGRHRRLRPGPGRRLPARRRVDRRPTASRRRTASTAKTSPGSRASARSPSRAAGGSRSRPRARSTARTSRSSAAASSRCACAPTTVARGTAIYEVTGSRHHRYFPDTVVDGVLPT